MYKFHHDYIKNKYVNSSRFLFTNSDSLVYEIKKEDVFEDFSKDKEICDFSNHSVKPKYYDSNKLLAGIMKDETGGIAIEGFVGLKPKMYLFLVDDSNEYKKAKGVNKNITARISYSE